MAKNERGQRGKLLETEVRDYLQEKKTARRSLTYYRLPDARTCMGRLKSQPGDYFIFQSGRPTVLLDPKELKTGGRINIKSRLSQLPKMVRYSMAGVRCFFLAYVVDTGMYYVVPSARVKLMQAEGAKSILLDKYKTFTSIEEAMEALL